MKDDDVLERPEFDAMAKKIFGLVKGTMAYGWVEYAYQAGRRAGAMDMRERAALEAEDCDYVHHAAEQIRALPVEE